GHGDAFLIKAGSGALTLGHPDSAGIPESFAQETIALPFNDTEAALSKLERHRADLAGVIIAPLMGSAVVPGDQAFIEALDEFTTEADVPLIFDEVISFRTAHGGIHTRYGVEPDLVTYGKVIGGGFPVGAFGGRADLMAGYDPRGGADITHSGTFNANPVTAAAGLAALQAYDADAVEHVNDLADDIAERARKIRDEHGVELRVNQYGSLFNLYLTPSPVRNYRDATRAADAVTTDLYFALLSEGVRLAPKLMGCTSTVMGQEHVETFAEALDNALTRVRPEMAARAPQLVH
ncbi:MAG: aminotransferase class III-fold pyridoxal phosphate-dependent enzyme, partial [Halobacteriales archaeon]|nr:aminotransferase class III-fold pyridoxal phosphate-dependent enzyme [Halobacteriales archaeon]